MQADDIRAEYERRLLAHPHANWGWSFMYTPETTLDRAKIMLIGLNPGRERDDPAEPTESWAHDGANAYTDQSWGANGDFIPLQRQVFHLFSALNVSAADVFTANLVPFRSRSWRDLPDQAGALEFGRTLWKSLLPRSPARLFISLGKEAGRQTAAFLGARIVRSYKVDWGSQVIDEYVVASDGRTVLSLPHLSRFRIFGTREAAAKVVKETADRVLA